MPLLTVSKYQWKDVARAYMEENFDRNVKWLLMKHPGSFCLPNVFGCSCYLFFIFIDIELAQSLPEPTVDSKRLSKTFAGKKGLVWFRLGGLQLHGRMCTTESMVFVPHG